MQAVLERPVFGTAPRPQKVYVEGRIPSLEATSIKVQIGVIVGAIVLFVLLNFGIDRFADWMNSKMCTPGWFGDGNSLGLQLWALVMLLVLLLATGYSVDGIANGYGTWRRRRNVPEGKKPLFRTRLVEGKAAARLGLSNMICCVVFLAASSVGWYYYVAWSPVFFHAPIKEIHHCQAMDCPNPQQDQKNMPTQGNSK